MIVTLVTTSRTNCQSLVIGIITPKNRKKISKKIHDEVGELVVFSEFETDESLVANTSGFKKALYKELAL